jgi:hypothetical protein
MSDTNEQSELIQALAPVVEYFNEHDIDYFIVGSVASSHDGAARSTLDVDLSASLAEDNITSIVSCLSSDYCVSEPAIRDAIRRKSCFNLIHLSTSFKIDIFINNHRPFDRVAQSRSLTANFGESHKLLVRIATKEDIIPIKLQWYRLGNESSERQWNDLTTFVKLNRSELDLGYLGYWALELNVNDLLERLQIT